MDEVLLIDDRKKAASRRLPLFESTKASKDEMPEHEKRFFKALNRLKSRSKRQKGNGNGRYKTPKPQNIIMGSSQLGSGARMSRSAEGRLIDPDTERQMRARATARARFATGNGSNGGFSELGRYLFGNGK